MVNSTGAMLNFQGIVFREGTSFQNFRRSLPIHSPSQNAAGRLGWEAVEAELGRFPNNAPKTKNPLLPPKNQRIFTEKWGVGGQFHLWTAWKHRNVPFFKATGLLVLGVSSWWRLTSQRLFPGGDILIFNWESLEAGKIIARKPLSSFGVQPR